MNVLELQAIQSRINENISRITALKSLLEVNQDNNVHDLQRKRLIEDANKELDRLHGLQAFNTCCIDNLLKDYKSPIPDGVMFKQINSSNKA